MKTRVCKSTQRTVAALRCAALRVILYSIGVTAQQLNVDLQ